MRDPNDFSVVARLRLDNFTALFTGDIGPGVEDEILSLESIGDVNYIKIPHHGSKNGLSKELLEATSPEVAIISVGADNYFGHPNIEVIDMLDEAGVRTFRTDEVGDVEIVTDGEEYWRE